MSISETSEQIGLVVAMDAELIHFLRAHPPITTVTRDCWAFHHLEVGGRTVIAIRSGMGLINAAAATERLIAEYHPAMLLNFGCSGAHRREILPGDLVIGERVVHHSAMQILKDGSERYAGFGYDVGGERMDAAELMSDRGLVTMANDIATTIQLDPWPSHLFWPKAVERRTPTIHAGTVASADIWTQATDRLDVLHGRHGSLCEDMEAASIAQICALHETPFISIKDISNNEYLQVSDLDGFTDFPVEEIGKRAAAFTAELISRLP